MRGWLCLVVMVAAGGCRQHVLDDGDYALTFVETVRDDCSLASAAGLPGTGRWSTAGHLVHFDASLFAQRLSGFYSPGTEHAELEGTATNVSFDVRGVACRFDSARVALDVTASEPSRFAGTFSLGTVAAQHDECSCQLWTRVDGARR